jgi:hypothetical protein
MLGFLGKTGCSLDDVIKSGYRKSTDEKKPCIQGFFLNAG